MIFELAISNIWKDKLYSATFDKISGIENITPECSLNISKPITEINSHSCHSVKNIFAPNFMHMFKMFTLCRISIGLIHRMLWI